MDAESRTHVLTSSGVRLTLAAAALVAAGCGGEPAPPPSLPALAPIATVLRLPAGGGRAVAFSPDSLLPLPWTSLAGVPPLSQALGYDLDERIVWALDQRARLVGIDLQSGGWRAYLSGVRRARVGPDGSVYVVDTAVRLVRLTRRSPSVLPAGFRAVPAGLWGAINGQAIALQTDSSAGIRLVSGERAGPATPAGQGPVLPTFWGELVAVAEGERLRLVRPADGSEVRTLDLPGTPVDLAFSPSGHRLYALIGRRIVVADRFTGDRVASLELPADGQELRLDASGRWAMVRPPAGDSAWVFDLATGRRLPTIGTAWRADLPLVAGASTLVVATGDDVEAVDLAAASPIRITVVPGGAEDLWLSIPWVPPGQAPLAQAAADSALARQDAGLLSDSAGSGPVDEVWLQVSSSQNPDWAGDLAAQLVAGGHRATVWRPVPPDESYRVVVGPYPSRAEAEAGGRRLGRPYFVVRRPRQP